MSNFYAQLDNNNVVVGVSDMGGVYLNPSYKIIDSYDLSLLGRIYNGPSGDGLPFDPNDWLEVYTPPYTGTSSANITNSLIFPENIVSSTNLHLIKLGTTANPVTNVKFWEGFELGVDEYYQSSYISTVNDTSTQTIVDITGSGILTNVVASCPALDSSTMTITVTVDGFAKVFTSGMLTSVDKYVLGYVAPRLQSNGMTSGIEWGEKDRLLITPQELVYRYGTGFKFESSMKIEVQCDNGMSTDTLLSRAAATYMTHIPQGF